MKVLHVGLSPVYLCVGCEWLKWIRNAYDDNNGLLPASQASLRESVKASTTPRRKVEMEVRGGSSARGSTDAAAALAWRERGRVDQLSTSTVFFVSHRRPSPSHLHPTSPTVQLQKAPALAFRNHG